LCIITLWVKKLNERIVDEILKRIDIVDVVSTYVNLKKVGTNFRALCPFHTEKTPSFYVSPSKQIFHCFGCGVGGNAIHFLMKVENLTFTEALRILASKVNINIDNLMVNNKKERELIKLKEQLYKLNEHANHVFIEQLFNRKNVEAVKYILKRQLSKDIVKKFNIGFCPGNLDLYSILKKEYDEEILEKSGLFIFKNEKHYCRFDNRIIFPIMDTMNRIIAFGGRIIEEGKQPKYLNSPETTIFSKSKALYAINFAKNSVEDYFLVVEGYMDAISLYQGGVTNVVGVLGTSLTVDHSYIIKRYKNNVYLCLDNDEAGEKAALRSAEILYKNNLTVYMVELEGAKDPDEYIKRYGIEVFQLKKQNAIYFIDYLSNQIKNKYDLNIPNQKIAFIKEYFNEVLNKLQTEVEVEEYLNILSKITLINFDTLKKQYEKERVSSIKKGIQYSIQKRDVVAENINNSDALKEYEAFLLSLFIEWSSKNSKFAETITEDDFKTQENKEIFLTIKKMMDEGMELSYSSILSLFEDEKIISLLTNFNTKGFDSFEKAEKAIYELKNRINYLYYEQLLNKIDKEKDYNTFLEIYNKLKQYKM